MTATVTDTPTDAPDITADQIRRELQNAGWRSLTDATDIRRIRGAEGAELTILWYPEFRKLGVPQALIRAGRVEIPDTCPYAEVYRSTGRTWIPVD